MTMPSHTIFALHRVMIAAALASAAFAAACDRATGPTTGKLAFQLDPSTCSQADSVEFFIDTMSRGKYMLAPGQQQVFAVPTGPHSAAASLLGIYVTSVKPVYVPSHGAAVFTVGCYKSNATATPVG